MSKKKKREEKREEKKRKQLIQSMCRAATSSEWKPQEETMSGIGKEMFLRKHDDAGIFFGEMDQYENDYYIGMPQGSDGNIAVIGGSGSGKSTGIVNPTLRTWKGAICATDIKGELSNSYIKFYEKAASKGATPRPYIIFDPSQVNGPSYDPFWWILQDREENLVPNILEISYAIIPILQEDNQPFWVETERSVFAAALLHYVSLGLSFSETILRIINSTVSAMCKDMLGDQDIRVRMLLGEVTHMKPETLASIDRGLRNKLIVFATDPHICHSFRGMREGANCFNWSDLDKFNIFLRLPGEKIEQWSGAINLMYTQLIRYLERRPEQYSKEGKGNTQTLLLLDEFSRFGKLEMITAAISTLRSKNVNICIVIQSLAQLDKVYGEYDRRIIIDNCQYQAILRANDAETQRYLCESIGTTMRRQYSVSESLDLCMKQTGYGVQVGEIRDWTLSSHELAKLKNVILLTPHGFAQVKKIQFGCNQVNQVGLSMLVSKHNAETISGNFPVNLKSFQMNEGVEMLTIEERGKNANQRVYEAQYSQKLKQKQALDAKKKKSQRRNFIVGELVAKYFPEVLEYEPGTQAENVERFRPLETFLRELATDQELVAKLKGKISTVKNSEALLTVEDR